MAQTIFAGSVTGDGDNRSPSRLSTSSQDLRNVLESRNLYDQFREYPLQPTDTQSIVNSISAVINTVAPFKSKIFNNTVLARLITSPSTPLSDIGLEMLGKQFLLNFQSNLVQQTFPQINLANVTDGNPNTNLFSLAKNYSITRKPSGGTLNQFIDDFFGINLSTYNPFNNNPTQSEYLKNTGREQLRSLYNSLNKNIYKSNDPTLVEYGDVIEQPLEPRSIIIEGKLLSDGKLMSYYNFSDSDFNPYVPITPYNTETYSNYDMRQSYRDTGKITDLYAPSTDFILNNFGSTEKGRDKLWEDVVDGYLPYSNVKFRVENNQWIDKETGFNEDVNNQFVWGRDGVNEYANSRLQALRGVNIEAASDTVGSGSITAQDPENFNIKAGLLEYTRNLLNSTKGQVVDQTRKVFKDGNSDEKIAGFNGSGIWAAPDSALERFRGSKGLRQHTILDQYDRFAKAIRFDGNQVYGGNPDSVIYKSVVPRIHPTLNDETNELNNKNLMFSIENLAVNVIRGEDYGVIDDEFGTQIPSCEVGAFNGRMMWFPPYDLNLIEVASAKYDPTVMVGRSEPIYTYMYSERTATLTFKLLIDYPPHVKNAIVNKDHKTVSEFFAFGGPEYEESTFVNNSPKKEDDNNVKIEEITGRVTPLKPDITEPSPILVSFPNDMPNTAQVNNIVDLMYGNYKYEIREDIETNDKTNFGLNENIYYLTGIITSTNPNIKSTLTVPPGFSQYNYEGSHTKLDEDLMRLFEDEDNRKYFEILVVGAASKLYTPGNAKDIAEEEQYNEELGLRRANSIKYLIEQRIKKLLKGSAEDLGIVIRTGTVGSSVADNENGTIDAIPEEDTKEERVATISFRDTGISPIDKKVELIPEDKQAVETLTEEKQVEQANKNFSKKRGGNSDCVYNERGITESDKDSGVLKGFKSITDNYYYPVFHSQTPEDFHKRLTFLQQCTRQGSAIRSNPEVDANDITRVKNSVFGRQPICVLRVGDFFYTKVIIETVTVDYSDAPWDTNPEGFGMQPMIADVTLQMRVMGGQSLKGPIDALQNAVSFNYYANSNYTNQGMYKTPSAVADNQASFKEGILTEEQKNMKEDVKNKYDDIMKNIKFKA